MDRVDPKEWGLHARVVLEQVDENTLALVMNRRSRIIMADGKKILEKVKKMQKIRPGLHVLLKTPGPVCSKTKSFLQQSGVTIVSLES